MPLGREGAREVHRDARLADAALARGDGDHGGIGAGEEGRLLLRAAPPRRVDTSEARCSSLIGERETSTRSTPSIGASASVTSLVIRSLRGQPRS